MKNKKSKSICSLALVLMLSVCGVAYATSYSTSITIAANSNLYGADRSYTGNRYSVDFTVDSIDNGNNSTNIDMAVVHNNYNFLGMWKSADRLSYDNDNINVGYSYLIEFPNNQIGSGTRAFNFSTVGRSGFSSNSLKLSSY